MYQALDKVELSFPESASDGSSFKNGHSTETGSMKEETYGSFNDHADLWSQNSPVRNARLSWI
jgi:hypothetical protein